MLLSCPIPPQMCPTKPWAKGVLTRIANTKVKNTPPPPTELCEHGSNTKVNPPPPPRLTKTRRHRY